ncbi:regulation of nuclear pre-mRNA domain-containing protein 1A isoform X1 [Cynara cardunculus var. scolymus]|uniref:regulation of nuclear pre-mRNA domain-containing protein 1A isoform X1 n=1 Tax=Cynara cardunculus var. scolymus TaxID=59895 RepID=UPI000D625C97|nr:regulation of nuclear pre-mRNA domain-containing protein 1A isoform X1 [Cynara cardunculus var. scolymus]
MNSVFNEQILADKLSKLNSTQQCIETLSHWCIFHRSKAELIVTTWEKLFHSSEVAQKVPLLYLANDILQNSKRKGNEFVSEFWKVLPGALKDLIEKGDDHGKNVVTRLVNIWEERKVFGSRAKNIKAVLLGEESPQPLEFTKKRSRSVKIVKRDLRSIRTKLTIGSTAERIVSAFHLVVSEHHGEDEEMNKCKSAVHRVRKMEKEIDLALTNAKDPKRKTLSKVLEEEEYLLKQCIEKLKVVEANRLTLVSQLRDALNDQESELENVRTQMQVAQAQSEEAENMRKQLDDENYVADSKPSTATPPSVAADAKAGSKKSAADIAAEVADRLAASTSSQYIMSSVLSTFAAEEAKNAGLTKTTTVSNSFSAVSKPERPLPVSDHNVFMTSQTLNLSANGPYQTVLIPQPTLIPNSQAQYHSLSNPHSQQYMQQPSGGIVTSYAYANVPPLPAGPPPPPPPSYMMSPMVPLTHQQMQMSHQAALPQQAPTPSFRPIQPSGMVFYAHPHHSQ